jgi:hypothetical protein
MPRNTDDDDDLEFMNREQVAKLFRISTKTVTRRVQARLLPPPIRGTHLWSRKLLRDHIAKIDDKKTRRPTPRKKRNLQGDKAHRALGRM